ncbi:MAG: VOC family protein [Rhodanobacteraceae bacterium]
MSSPPFRLRQLDHVVLRVRDVAGMRRFYCDVLGCTRELDQAEIGLFQLRAGESLIDLVDVDGKLGRMGGAAPAEQAHNVDHVCLSVDGYDEGAIVAHLEAHGVRVGEIGLRYGAEGQGPSIYLFDPEGNKVELKGPPIPDSRAGGT